MAKRPNLTPGTNHYVRMYHGKRINQRILANCHPFLNISVFRSDNLYASFNKVINYPLAHYCAGSIKFVLGVYPQTFNWIFSQESFYLLAFSGQNIYYLGQVILTVYGIGLDLIQC